MISKELFCQGINAVRKQSEYDCKISENLSKAFPNAFKANLMPDNQYLYDMTITLLQEAMQDTVPDEFGYTWIVYFISELDFGKKPKTVIIKDKQILLDTPEKLYDILISNDNS